MRWRSLKSRSELTRFTRSWQSSKTPSIAMLKMFASWSEYICAAWNGLMRPWGESMNTFTRALPLSAYSADEPVSPLVAPSTLRFRSCFSRTCSKRFPRSCSAMSLNASVGPLERPRTCRFGSSVLSGVISGVPKTSGVYVRSTIPFSAAPGKSSAKKRMISNARRGYGRSRIASSLGRVIRGHCSGTARPPSGARPSSRMSVKDCCALCPRVLTYFRGVLPALSARSAWESSKGPRCGGSPRSRSSRRRRG